MLPRFDAGAAPSHSVAPPPLPPQQPSTDGARALDTEDDAEMATLEGSTADLLRPLLREWLSDNMPRIVEKALRIEVARAAKPPGKPPRS